MTSCEDPGEDMFHYNIILTTVHCTELFKHFKVGAAKFQSAVPLQPQPTGHHGTEEGRRQRQGVSRQTLALKQGGMGHKGGYQTL